MDKGKQHKRKHKRIRYDQIFQWKYKEEHGTAKKGFVAATSPIKRRIRNRYGKGRLALWKKKFLPMLVRSIFRKTETRNYNDKDEKQRIQNWRKICTSIPRGRYLRFESGSSTVTTLKECWICLNVARNLWTWTNLNQLRSLGFSKKDICRI